MTITMGLVIRYVKLLTTAPLHSLELDWTGLGGRPVRLHF